jgi:hypothetical protein
MNLYDVVALLEDLPEHDLKRGQVGTVVETWDDNLYEVEFADTRGVAYAFAALRPDQVMTLYWHRFPASA